MSGDGDATSVWLHEPVQPPRYPISPTSQGGYAFIAAVIMIAIAGMATLVKLQITATTFRKMRRDDIALIGALLFGLGSTIAICRSVNNGLGRTSTSLTSAQVQKLSESYLAANALLWVSLACSKCAIAFLVVAIQPARWMAICLYTICAISAAWAVAALCVTVLQCGPNRWVMGPTHDDTCIDQYAAQVGIRIVDILTDIALAVLPGIMMLSVQVPAPKKAAVAFIFGLRLITPVFTALALASYADFYAAPTRSRPFEAVVPSVWSSVAMGLSLITACLPSIKRFLMDWAAGVSNNMVGTTEYDNTTSSGRRPQASGLRSFAHSRITASKSRGGTLQESEMYTSYARGGRGADIHDDGDSSKGLTQGIMQTTDVQVRYDEER